LYDFRDENPDFAAAWDKMLKRAAPKLKEDALRRAMKGVLEPVFFRGRKCGSVRKYSDSLLLALMKAAFPEEFAERKKSEVAGANGGAITIRWAEPGEFASEDPADASKEQEAAVVEA
jgi:hypothetical protein